MTSRRTTTGAKAKICRRKQAEKKHSMVEPCKKAVTQRSLPSATSPIKTANLAGRHCVSDPKPKSKRRHVQFSSTIEVETRHASKEDLKNSWFAGDDYVIFERDCGRTIAAIRKAWSLRKDGSPMYRLSAQEFTASGLEDMLTEELKRHRGFLKGRHHHHVLMEQHLQRTHGVVDPEQLQAVSQLFSTESCHIALQRGSVKSY